MDEQHGFTENKPSRERKWISKDRKQHSACFLTESKTSESCDMRSGFKHQLTVCGGMSSLMYVSPMKGGSVGRRVGPLVLVSSPLADPGRSDACGGTLLSVAVDVSKVFVACVCSCRAAGSR